MINNEDILNYKWRDGIQKRYKTATNCPPCCFPLVFDYSCTTSPTIKAMKKNLLIAITISRNYWVISPTAKFVKRLPEVCHIKR